MSDIDITVEVVESVEDHPDADRLDIVKILGTQCVVPKGEYLGGEKVVYFPPNMIIPEEEADNLGVKKYLKNARLNGEKVQGRIAACRIRGVPSYGFIAPYASLQTQHDLLEHTDVTLWYRGEKYEPPEPSTITGGGGRRFGLEDGALHRYTNIRNYYRHPNLFEDDERVVITEKIHGCLQSQTRVRMANGSSKCIRDIKIGEYVAGLSRGAIVPSKVLQVFENGVSGDWLKIQFTRERCGRGSAIGSVTCTPNHQFLIGDDYQDASTLKAGDQLSVLRSDWHLSHIQEQILLGKMLGDGCLCQTSASAYVEWGHVSEDLTEWTAKGLRDLCGEHRGSRISGYGSLIHTAKTHSSVFILDKFESFIKGGKKIVPTWVAKELTPLAIAFWYMDDGSLAHQAGQEDRALFAVCGFSKTDCQVLVEALKKYCITAVYYVADGYSRIRLNADEAEKLFLLIAPYIPSSLQYKLPERYRGHTGWLPETENSYKTELVPQTVTEITSLDVHQQRWDLETETHNYLPSNVVTHNSNSRVGVILEDGEWVFAAGSHRARLAPSEEPSRYWTPLQNEPMLNMLTEMCSDRMNNVVVFGEIFGPSVQDMDYGIEGDTGYRVFDISMNGHYIDWHYVMKFCNHWDVLTVPALYEGPWKLIKDKLDEYASGLTSVGTPERKFKGREGIVIKATSEHHTEGYGPEHLGSRRKILKYISVDYLARKGGQDNA